jgi:TRAP-type mannitol/chloroaromatic compound transport system permease large subunit
MSGPLLGFLALFLLLVLTGMPIAWAMAGAVLAYMAFTGQWQLLPALPEKIFQGMDAFVLVAIPMFLLAGDLFSEGGIAHRLVAFASVLLGKVSGGVA